MKKRHVIMDDPRLDRIFNDAYAQTMRDAAVAERSKRVGDHVDAFAEIFERELGNRDLTPHERRDLIDQFRTRVLTADAERDRRRRARRRKLSLTTAVVAGAAAIVLSIYLAAYQPFRPIDGVTADLTHYVERVEAGYGEYSRKFFRLLERQDRRLGPTRAQEFQGRMYDALDERFAELVARVEDGRMSYYDDARDWAGYYPEPEERKAKRQIARNARSAGLGVSVGDSVESIVEGAKEIIGRAVDAIKEAVEDETE